MPIAVSSREYRIYGAFIRPRPCSAEMDPLFSATVLVSKTIPPNRGESTWDMGYGAWKHGRSVDKREKGVEGAELVEKRGDEQGEEM